MGFFTYPDPYPMGGKATKQSVITRELAEHLADHFARPDLYSHDGKLFSGYHMRGKEIDTWGRLGWQLAHEDDAALSNRIPRELSIRKLVVGMSRYHGHPELFALVDGLPQGWDNDVTRVMNERDSAKAEAAHRAAIEQIDTTPAIRAHLQRTMNDRYSRPPERRPFQAGYLRVGYAPEPCTSRLLCSEAVTFYYEQASYADHSRWLIPVSGAIADPAKCRGNLSRWCEAMRTHTGYAGSGSNYSATLHITDLGAYVELDQRASISD
jgi:hypothetical protein